MKEVKPIKRSAYLAPLSREHHEDLLLAWKIREGVKKGISYDRITRYCLWFFEHQMKDHFKKEEHGFAAILNTDHPLMQTMLIDHRSIRASLKDLSINMRNKEELEKFAFLISSHVRYEERQLFNYIEKVATKKQLETLTLTLDTHPLPVWDDEFWMNK